MYNTDWHKKLLDARPDELDQIAQDMADEIDDLRTVAQTARHIDDMLSESHQKLSDALADYYKITEKPAFRFANVSCSQCGGEFGPGDHGFSHCDNHSGLARR